jgi:hypothetical protein
MAKNGPVAPPITHFHPYLSFHPSGEPRPSPPPPGACLGSLEETNARKTPRIVPARLVAPTCRQERAVVILITLSSARCKSLPPTDV